MGKELLGEYAREKGDHKSAKKRPTRPGIVKGEVGKGGGSGVTSGSPEGEGNQYRRIRCALPYAEFVQAQTEKPLQVYTRTLMRTFGLAYTEKKEGRKRKKENGRRIGKYWRE